MVSVVRSGHVTLVDPVDPAAANTRTRMSAAITETIDVDAPPEQAFDYVANFGHLDEWDPTFDSAVRTDTSPLGVASTFRVATEVAGNEVVIDYRITEFRRPERVVLVGHSSSFTSTDTIEFAPHGKGTTVTYHAEVDTEAPDWVDAVGTPLFKLVGKLSARGMRDALSDDA